MPGKDLNPMVLLVTWSSGSTSGFFCSSMWIFALWRWCTELFSYQQIGLKAVTARMSCVSRRLFCALTMGRWMVYLCTVKYNLTPSTQHLQPVGCFNKQVNQRRLFCSKADAGWLKSRVTTRSLCCSFLLVIRLSAYTVLKIKNHQNGVSIFNTFIINGRHKTGQQQRLSKRKTLCFINKQEITLR